MEGTLSPYACGSSQLVQVVGIKCDVTQMATVVLAKTLGRDSRAVTWSRGLHHNHFWAMWLWASHLSILSLNFLIWKQGSNFNFSRLLPGLEER